MYKIIYYLELESGVLLKDVIKAVGKFVW